MINFPMKNVAVHKILRFVEKEYIKNYIDFIKYGHQECKEKIEQEIKYYNNSLLRFTDEFEKIIFSYNPNLVDLYFVELIENLKHLKGISKQKIINKINQWNEIAKKNFLSVLLRKKEIKAQLNEIFKEKDLIQISAEEYSLVMEEQMLNMTIPDEEDLDFNLIKERNLINIDGIDEYFRHFVKLRRQFISESEKYVKLYDQGKLKQGFQPPIEQNVEIVSDNVIPKSKELIFTEDELLIWDTTDINLIELITALIESKSIRKIKGKLHRNFAIKIIGKFFGKELKYSESKLSHATERKGSISPYLDGLSLRYENYLNNKFEQKVSRQ